MEIDQHLTGGILIVEDHAPTIMLLKKLIRSTFPDLEIGTVESAEAALILCNARLPRLVILDINLPGISGIEAIELFKAMSQNIRVVMHTGKDEAVYREKSFANGADKFVSKSNTFSDLIPTIRPLLYPISAD